ncbi:MAG: hypothetical protein RLZ71_117 [Actinomycetota bacterium]|jgi:hypothetical protein
MDEISANTGRIDFSRWRDEIRAIGNTNPLLNFESNSYGQLDLLRAHPGGIAQFVSSRSTLLSNLYREPLTFSRGYSAAKRIRERAQKISANQGIETLYLVGGLVGLVHDGFDLNLPVLLWPIALNRKVDDFEVQILGEPFVNPGLVAALEVSYGAKLDSRHLLALVSAAHELVPISVLQHISSLVGERANLETKSVLTIGNFAVEPVLLENDVKPRETALLRALAGLELAPEETPTNPIHPVVDADETQRRVTDRVVAGHSFAVETLPGCGYTQVVVNTLAALAGAGKRVLVVAPRRQTLNELADRLSSVGLGGLGIRSNSVWFDLVSAISRHEKAQAADLPGAEAALASATSGISEYYSSLAQSGEAGTSIEEVLRRLSALALMPHAPTTSARLKSAALLEFHDHAPALELLFTAEELGEFKFGPQDTAWFQARFDSQDEVAAAVSLATKLSSSSMPELKSAMNELAAKMNLREPASVEQWGDYLAMLEGIRLTLDRFVDEVFERDLTDLVTATSQRTVRSEMSGSTRRKLRKLAKEYLRPGVHVTDLHVALKEIQEQKILWDASVLVESSPWVPKGINDLKVMYQAFVGDLAQLQVHLDPSPESVPLIKQGIEELARSLKSMATDAEALANLEERTALQNQLREAGLGSVARDFARLHVKREHVKVEFELAYWQSMLEYLVAQDGRILGFTAERIEALEEDFRIADAAVVTEAAKALAKTLADRWHQSLAAHPEQADALKTILKSRSATIRGVTAAAPALVPPIAPIVFCSPFEVPRILDDAEFDVALILDAAGTTVAENLSALQRVSQVVTFGDDAIAAPYGFEIECNEVLPLIEPSDRSVFAVVREVFGVQTLRRSWRANGQALGSLINREFYQNRIIFEPTAAEYMGESSFSLVTCGSLEVELQKTVHLVLEHAAKNPEDSLLVATSSYAHAERIRDEVSRQSATKPELQEFFDGHGREGYEVVTIAELGHRIADRVVFSLGVDKLPELLADANARVWLANLLVSARERITMLTSLSKFPEGWAVSPLLTDIIQHAVPEAILDSEEEPDPMLADLASRLRKLGARVTLGFGDRLPLVVSYGNQAGVVEADWTAGSQPLSDRLRLRPALLQAMGWKILRVHSFELFSDPQMLALRIGIAMGMPLSKTQPMLFDEPSFDETDAAWGDRGDSNDRRLRDDKPPHWG